jgi:hypothetical protein
VVQRSLRHGPAQLVTRLGRAQIRFRCQISPLKKSRGTQSLVSTWANQFQLAIFVRPELWLQIYVALVHDVCVMGVSTAHSPEQTQKVSAQG